MPHSLAGLIQIPLLANAVLLRLNPPKTRRARGTKDLLKDDDSLESKNVIAAIGTFHKQIRQNDAQEGHSWRLKREELMS